MYPCMMSLSSFPPRPLTLLQLCTSSLQLAAEHSNLKALIVCHHPKCQGIMKITPRSLLGGQNADTPSSLWLDHGRVKCRSTTIISIGRFLSSCDVKLVNSLSLWFAGGLMILCSMERRSGLHDFQTTLTSCPIVTATSTHKLKHMHADVRVSLC